MLGLFMVDFHWIQTFNIRHLFRGAAWFNGHFKILKYTEAKIKLGLPVLKMIAVGLPVLNREHETTSRRTIEI